MLSEQNLQSRGIRSVELTTSDKHKLHAIYLPNDHSDILTIYFHGNGGNIHQRADVLEKIRSLGSSVLGVSYRGYLFSTGTPSEKGIYEDGKAALQYALDTLGYSKKNIILFGRSLGSAVAICLLYTSPSPRDKRQSRMPSSA